MSREDLATVLAQVSQELSHERDEALTAARICRLALEVIDGGDHATLGVRARRHRLAPAEATSEVATVLQESQLSSGTGTGPTVTAFETAEPIVSHDLAVEERWSGWLDLAAPVQSHGVRSVAAVPLLARGRTQAVMTLWSHHRGAWMGATHDAVLLYATHAAAALDAAKIITGLETALGTRHRIGAAQGILMERHRLTLHQAFSVLQCYSSTSNEPLSDVAAQVVEESERGYAGPDPREAAAD